MRVEIICVRSFDNVLRSTQNMFNNSLIVKDIALKAIGSRFFCSLLLPMNILNYVDVNRYVAWYGFLATLN